MRENCARCDAPSGAHPQPGCGKYVTTRGLLEGLLDEVADAAGLDPEDRGDPEALVDCIAALRADLARKDAALREIEALAHDPDPEVQASIAAGDHPPPGATCPMCEIDRIARAALKETP